MWTNACCGHPRIGESLRDAVRRHLGTELNVAPTAMSLVFGDFVYRATMGNGTMEHEWCPVVVATIDGDAEPNRDEVDDLEWTPWASLVDRAREHPDTLSPWCVLQVERLAQATSVWRNCSARRTLRTLLLDRVPGTNRATAPSIDPIVSPVRDRVDSYLSSFLHQRCGDVAEADDAMHVLHSAVGGLAGAGGKRLRPAFVEAGYLAAGGDRTPCRFTRRPPSRCCTRSP